MSNSTVVNIMQAPEEMTEQTLRVLVRAQHSQLQNDAQRLYVRLRTDSCASSASARKATGITKAESDKLDDTVIKYAHALRSRRIDVDRSEVLAMFDEVYAMGKDRKNPAVMLNAARAIAEISGCDRPATDLHDLPTDGTASTLNTAILEKVSAGAISVDQATKLMAGVKSAADTQLAEEERARMQVEKNANPHATGTVPWQNVEQNKRAERNMRLIWEKLDREKEERQTLINPEDSQ